MPHYTSQNMDFFVERITSDFIGQIAQRLESSGMTQSELAQKLDVSESEVSQVMNLNRVNFTLKKMARLAQALGMKVALVAYDDRDPGNERGPVGSEIFSQSWESLGRPRKVHTTCSQNAIALNHTLPSLNWNWNWNCGAVNTTLVSSDKLDHYDPEFPIELLQPTQKAATHARV